MKSLQSVREVLATSSRPAGFTERQSAFLKIVMLQSGVFVDPPFSRSPQAALYGRRRAGQPEPPTSHDRPGDRAPDDPGRRTRPIGPSRGWVPGTKSAVTSNSTLATAYGQRVSWRRIPGWTSGPGHDAAQRAPEPGGGRRGDPVIGDRHRNEPSSRGEIAEAAGTEG